MGLIPCLNCSANESHFSRARNRIARLEVNLEIDEVGYLLDSGEPKM